MDHQKKLNIEYAFMLGVFWASNGLAFNFAIVYLQHRGYSNYGLGLILAVSNILSFLIQPVIANYVDKRNKKPLLICILITSLFSLLCGLIAAIVENSGLIQSAAYVLLLTSSVILQPLTNSASTYLCTWGYDVRFPRARSIGSLCFALCMMLMGFLTAQYSPVSVPVVYLILMALLSLITVLFIHQDKTIRAIPPKVFDNKAKAASSIGKFIKDNKRFCVYLCGVALLFFSHTVPGNFFIEFLRPLGGDSQDMGSIFCIMALSEMPAMLLFDRLTRRISCSVLLKISAVMFVAKALAYRLASSVGMMYFAACLQAFSFALFIPASVRYVELAIKKRDSVKGQAFTTCMITFGCILASYFGGLMLDNISTSSTLTVGVLAAAAGALLVFPGVRKTETTK